MLAFWVGLVLNLTLNHAPTAVDLRFEVLDVEQVFLP